MLMVGKQFKNAAELKLYVPPASGLTFDPDAKAGNCYAYALNLHISCLDPGNLTRSRGSLIFVTAQALEKGMAKDGLMRIRPHSVDPSKLQIMAAFLGRGDYHFYRRDNDGHWSHQLGKIDKPSRYDCDGTSISDPTRANRGRYEEFLGYYMVPPQGIPYRPG